MKKKSTGNNQTWQWTVVFQFFYFKFECINNVKISIWQNFSIEFIILNMHHSIQVLLNLNLMLMLLHQLFFLDYCHVYVFVFDHHLSVRVDFHVEQDASQLFFLVEDVELLMSHFHVEIFLDKLILILHNDQLVVHYPNLNK